MGDPQVTCQFEEIIMPAVSFMFIFLFDLKKTHSLWKGLMKVTLQKVTFTSCTCLVTVTFTPSLLNFKGPKPNMSKLHAVSVAC